jgi:hypothetical protein
VFVIDNFALVFTLSSVEQIKFFIKTGFYFMFCFKQVLLYKKCI